MYSAQDTLAGGFPHSEILGSKLVRSSPRLIAAYHVLHRLSAPRHPPNALKALDRSHYRCSCGSRRVTTEEKRPISSRSARSPRSSQRIWGTCPSRGIRTNLLFTMSWNRPRPAAPRRQISFSQTASHPARHDPEGWWSQTGSNRRPHACKARALPTELWPRSGSAPEWWARVDSNYRPHAYQACALTT